MERIPIPDNLISWKDIAKGVIDVIADTVRRTKTEEPDNRGSGLALDRAMYDNNVLPLFGQQSFDFSASPEDSPDNAA